jgi:drug/metabolite transporter (DMT)-like permease
MLVILCFVWGLTWPILRIALEQVPPFTMRTFSTLAGGLLLFAVCIALRRNLRLPGLKGWVHVSVAALLNIAGFGILSSFAQLQAATSRVAILAYTMPIWTVVLSWLFLGERPTGAQPAAIGLCICGLAILIYPLTTAGIPLGIVLAVATGMSWAAGTVYLKWARIEADAMAVAVWQVAISFFVIAACMLIFDGGPDFHAAHAKGIVAMVLSGLLGTGIAYGLWFSIIQRLPAMTASLGVLGSPVIGVITSVLMLGERPTTSDIVGFAMVLAASACVLFTRPGPADASSASKREKEKRAIV